MYEDGYWEDRGPVLIAASGGAIAPQSVYKHRRFLYFVHDVVTSE